MALMNDFSTTRFTESEPVLTPSERITQAVAAVQKSRALTECESNLMALRARRQELVAERGQLHTLLSKGADGYSRLEAQMRLIGKEITEEIEPKIVALRERRNKLLAPYNAAISRALEPMMADAARKALSAATDFENACEIFRIIAIEHPATVRTTPALPLALPGLQQWIVYCRAIINPGSV